MEIGGFAGNGTTAAVEFFIFYWAGEGKN